MVNLEEIKGEKKHYKTPVMEVEFLTWADIVTSSRYSMEGEINDVGGAGLTGGEGGGNDFNTP